MAQGKEAPSLPRRGRSRSRAQGLAFLVVLSLVLLLAVRRSESGSLALFREVRQYSWFAAAVVLTMWTVAGARLLKRRWLRLLTATVGAVAVLAVSAIGLLHFWLEPVRGAAKVAAPSERYSVVVEEGAWGIDTVWRVSVRQSRGLLSREWDVGCLNGDYPPHSFRAARWQYDETVVLITAGRRALVRVDTESGRPLTRNGDIWGCA